MDLEKDQYDEQILAKIKSSPFFQESLFKEYNSLDNGRFWCGFRIDKRERLYTIQKHIDNVKRWRKENEPFKPFSPIDRQKAVESTHSKVEWQMKMEQQQNNNIPHCPTCSSTNLKKISTTSKAANTALFGILGTKRYKNSIAIVVAMNGRRYKLWL